MPRKTGWNRSTPRSPSTSKPWATSRTASSSRETSPRPSSNSAGEEHHSGAAGNGPMFEHGATFNYTGDEARVWAHPRAANAGPRPLIILLHGLNESGDKHPSMAANAGKTGAGDKWIHVGKL